MTVFWDVAAFAANSLVFLLIGVRVGSSAVFDRAGLVALAFAVTLAARAVTIYGFEIVGYRVARSLGIGRLLGDGLPLRWQHILTWGGLRGTIALALVLSVPTDVAGRDTLVVLTFGVVLVSLLLQGLTMRPFVNALGLVARGDGATDVAASDKDAGAARRSDAE